MQNLSKNLKFLDNDDKKFYHKLAENKVQVKPIIAPRSQDDLIYCNTYIDKKCQKPQMATSTYRLYNTGHCHLFTFQFWIEFYF